jgi:predicted nucleic acid-binding protein
MSKAFEDACVTGYEDLIPAINLPDPDDRHILAAAVRGRADSIVTQNMKDFPETEIDKYGVTIQRLDAFLVDQYQLSPNRFISTLKAQAKHVNVAPQAILQKLSAPSLQQVLRMG